MSIKVLIVEDEIKLADLLNDYLVQAGMQTDTVADGNKVVAHAELFKPDIILLDIMLPNKDGLSLCRELRAHHSLKHVPIIMTTARVDEIDRLLGLEIGADDYVCKPYSPREVVARVKAMMRRLQNNHPQSDSLYFDEEKMQALWQGRNLELTAVEYFLLKQMASSVGKIFSRNQLMDGMYKDYRVVSERTIDSHIKKLRQKIAKVNDEVTLVHSVYGVGYKVEFEI